MAKRFKSTGFARFFIFLIIAAPLIYSAAALIKGENPLDAAKRDLGIDLTGLKSGDNGAVYDDNGQSTATDNEDTANLIEVLKSENYRLTDEVNELKAKLKDCQ